MLLEMNLLQKGLDQPKISFHKIMNFLEPKFGPTWNLDYFPWVWYAFNLNLPIAAYYL